MTLLNSLLALGALAFTIPLVIHLLHRSRFTTIDWGAWHLLDSVIRVNRRRMQIANLLLLLLRCLIPILLAFCLARPVLTGFRAMPGDAPRTIVIAIDDSRSMNASVSGQPSRLQQAKTGLTDFLKKLSRRDEVILVRSSTVDSPAATMGAADALDEIKQLKATFGPVDLSVMIDAAVGAAQQSSHAQTSVLLVSDFQSCNLTKSSLKSLDGISRRLSKIDPRPTVSFWNFGSESEKAANVSVESVTVDSPAVVAGRSTQFSARVRNAADVPTGDLRLVWSIDGVDLPPRTISIGERSSATARLNHRIDEPGVREVTVSVEHADSLADDNRRRIAVDVMREISVVLVDGKPSRRPLEGQADFLSIALSPFAFGGDDQPDSVRADLIRSSEITDTIANVRPEIVVLANVGTLDRSQRAALSTFVLQGGSLVVFDGDRVEAESFNTPWQSDAGALSFPARLGEIVGTPDERNVTVTTIAELNQQYSPWRLLAAANERPLSDVEVFAYRQLTVSQGEAATADEDAVTQEAAGESELAGEQTAASVLMTFGDGRPMVVLASRGRGQVCQFALPCDAAWSTLPLRLAYLPMMQQLVMDLAGRRKTTTLEVGQPISLPTSELKLAGGSMNAGAGKKEASAAESPSTQTRYSVQPPGEAEVSLTPAGESDGSSPRELQWLQTQVPGTYAFRSVGPNDPAENDESDAAESLITKTIRVVEVPHSESQLRSVDPDALKAVAKKVDANIYAELSDLQADDQTRRFGREIWRWLLLALLIGMVGELFLQQHLVGRRSAGAQSRVPVDPPQAVMTGRGL
ncbi:BatA domain-containing protein [Planctomycetes bacterium K23_9]|uniref:VWFA domain-containing protein n=1 Tax=Stieleria marina TaxID=1930275 RepID=A0A517NTN8_9BACT|nr:hypothetical protein K239x_24450 [Planctomycetes bacterium K23_9]